MQRRRKKADDINTNAWMDTYADTITLLLTFFILLYSFSSTDNEKLKLIASALRGEIAGTPMKVDGEIIDSDILELGVGSDNSYNLLVKKVTSVLNENGLNEVVKIREEDAGVILQLGNSILFDSENDELKVESLSVLDVISTVISQIDNEIMIQGHADNQPMYTTEFESGWDLSTARAISVVKYFVNTKGFDPSRFSATGHGQFKPLVPNDTEENRSINRRVDILIVQQRETTE